MPNFIETDVCKSRQNCVPCRRDSRFRDNFKKQTGSDWECPLSIPIDAKDEQFPSDILQRYQAFQKQMEERQKATEAAKVALEELSMVLTGENLERLEKIRSVFFPQTKIASKCKNSGSIIGHVDSKCCGGTIKKVDAYDCSKHIICTDKKCHQCGDFLRKDA